MTRTEAAEAARQFVADMKQRDREWTLNTVEAYLPKGWRLDEYADQAEFFPITVANVTAAILRNAEPA